MNNPLLHQIPTTCKDLLHNFNRILLSQFFLLFYVFMQVAMRTVFQDDIIKICSFDNLVQSHYIFMHQIFMNLDLSLQHLQIRSSKFFQLYHLDRISLMSSLNFHSLIYLTRVSLSQIIISGIFIDPDLDLMILQSIQLLHPFFLSIISWQRLKLIEISLSVSAKSPHLNYIVIYY